MSIEPSPIHKHRRSRKGAPLTVDQGSPTASAIDVRELSKTYPGGVEAVKAISFQVAASEVFGLLGPNAQRNDARSRNPVVSLTARM
jgi:ABC-type glutathione transport system ATPase component